MTIVACVLSMGTSPSSQGGLAGSMGAAEQALQPASRKLGRTEPRRLEQTASERGWVSIHPSTEH